MNFEHVILPPLQKVNKTNPIVKTTTTLEEQRPKRGVEVVMSHLKLSVGGFTSKENKNINYIFLFIHG